LRSAAREVVWSVVQLSGFAEVVKLLERLILDLPNPLAVTLNIRPISSSVRGCSPPSP
jgi:hypothetical protein